MTEARTIAASLTEAQRAVVLSLPDDDSFGKASSHTIAKYMWWGIGKGRATRLVEHQHCAGNSWCLNDLGLEVRSILANPETDR